MNSDVSMEAPAAETPETLTERAYRTLEEEIVMLRLPPGHVVSEALLSRRFAIGRTPIREALQRLARERLVVILPRRGIVVSEIDVASQLRLIELRREIERLIAQLAAARASDAQRQGFIAIATGMRDAAEANDDITFMRLDREMNQRLLDAARNEFAAGAMGLMSGLSRRFWYMHYREVADLPLAARLHADVVAAVGQGDEAEAAAASDRLIDYIEACARRTA